MPDRRLCVGCRDNFYNGNNDVGVRECWSLKTAKVVTRWRLGWWVRPDTPGAFSKVKTHDCHHAPGKYAHFLRLPRHAQASTITTPIEETTT